jgi:hypothetical protein
MALPEHLAEFERKVAARLADAVDEMRRSLHAQAERASSQLLTDIDSFRPALPPRLLEETELEGLARPTREESRGEVLRELKATVAALDGAPTQSAALEALLVAAQGSAAPGTRRAAIWLTHEDGMVGWGSAGFDGNGHDPLAGARLAYSTAPALERLARGRGTVRFAAEDAARLASELEVAAPHAAAIVPLVLRDHLAAALYVDRLDGSDDLELDLIQLLAHVTALRLELQGLTSRSYTPTLVLEDEAPAAMAGLPLWSPEALAEDLAPAAAAELAPAAPPVESAGETAAPEPAAAAFASPALVEPEPTSFLADSGFGAAGELAAPAAPAFPAIEVDEREILYDPGSDTHAEAIPTVDFGHPALDAPPAERFVLSPPPPIDLAPPVGRTEGSAAEIAWEMEEAESTVLLDGTPPAAPLADEATTGRIPIFEPPAPPPFAPFQREIGGGGEVVESTAEFLAPPAPEATQAIRPGSITTHEFELPEAEAPAVERGPDLSEDETVLVRRTAPIAAPIVEPSAPAPAAPVPLAIDAAPTPVEPPPPPAAPVVDDEPTVSRSRTTEVVPPPDLQGPGWAFTSSRAQRPTGENALHEEARRLARLLISEIKLYNEEQVEEGRRNRDIYHRLKDDIDRSRQIFEERVHESVRSTTDYFQQELVRSLAGGDPRALGI